MAGPRGYHNYRGRTPKGKIVLAVVLVLVILASAAFIFFQRNLVYGRDGKPYLDLPWGQEAQEDPQEEELDLTIQEPEKPETFTAFSVSGELLTSGNWRTARTEVQVSAIAYNAICVTLKDSAGHIYFDTPTAVPGAKRTAATTAADLAAINGGENETYYTIARLSCFLDPQAAAADVEGFGLKNTGGFLFYDGNNSQWLDPAKSAARQYLCQLAQEAAELGFDEILLTDVGYPTVGKLDKIAYGGVDRVETLCAFLEEMRAALDPYGVALSMELPEAVISEGADENAGLDLARVAPLVNRVYAEVTEESAAAQEEHIAAARTAVTAVSPGTDFVAELADHPNTSGGSCVVLK